MIYLFGLSVFIILMIGILGCMATIEEIEFRNKRNKEIDIKDYIGY